MRIHTALALAIAGAFAVSMPCSAQLGIFKGKDKETKAAENREKEVKKAEKEASRYEKLKEYSENLYENDPDFRDLVDQDFEQVLRDHSEMAFQLNLSRGSMTYAVHEDRFRRHVGLYDNLAIQDYVNRLGQKLVPPDSEKLFAFRLTPNPIPTAQTLSTGTIYISTGLVAMLDNEAQLAYVLAHEMAHVYKDHWKLKSIMKYGEARYNEKQEMKAAMISGIAGAVGAGLGGAIGRSGNAAALGGVSGLAAGAIAGMILNPSMHVEWDKVQEDEADRIAFKACLDANYDVREVPKLYAALQNAGVHDSRVTLGFMGNRKRVRERTENVRDLIEKAYKADIELKLSKGDLVGDNPEYRHLMAELKRDNGIMAFYYDMFGVARANLEEAVAIRSNDPAAHYYYGKVLELVGRTPEERKMSDQEFLLAIRYDTRGQNYGSHLHRALELMRNKTNANQKAVVDELQAYVNAYIAFSVFNARGSRLLPPNLDTILEYLTLLGDTSWLPQLPQDAPMDVEANELGTGVASSADTPVTVTKTSAPAPAKPTHILRRKP